MATVDYNSLKVKELKAILDEKEVSYKSKDTKADLIQMIEGAK